MIRPIFEVIAFLLALAMIAGAIYYVFQGNDARATLFLVSAIWLRG